MNSAVVVDVTAIGGSLGTYSSLKEAALLVTDNGVYRKCTEQQNQQQHNQQITPGGWMNGCQAAEYEHAVMKPGFAEF